MLVFPMTREQLEQKRLDLKANGVLLEGDEGEVSSRGVTLAYKYDGTNLAVEIVGKPRFVTRSFVEGKVKGWIER